MKQFAILSIFTLLLPVLPGCATMEEKKAYYDANVQMAKLQKPLFLMRAKAGQNIELKGVEEIAIYAPGEKGVTQYRDESIAAARDAAGVIGAIAGIYVGGEAAVRLVDAAGRAAGTQISNSFNGGSGQSSVNWAPGNSTGDTSISVPSDSHDDNSDSHDEIAEEN